MQSLTILYRTPSGDSSPYHQRRLDGVPKAVLEEMADDFRRAADSGSERSPHQLYRYEKNGDERLIAVDYGEVVGLFSGGTNTNISVGTGP